MAPSRIPFTKKEFNEENKNIFEEESMSEEKNKNMPNISNRVQKKLRNKENNFFLKGVEVEKKNVR